MSKQRAESEPGVIIPRRCGIGASRVATAAACVVIALASATWVASATAQPTQPTAKSSVAAGVTVSVTPGPFTASEWSFKVVLDTHTQNLDDDLRNTAVLLVDGVELHPALWSAPGGGHHREGVLTFSAPTQRPGIIELRIARPNEPQPRVFQWDGASLP